MRSRLIALGAVVLLALAGCGDEAAGSPAVPPPPTVEQPAASAGGACILWDFASIEKRIGVRFSVAAADQTGDASTCVVQTEDADYPDLVLSVVESTTADGTLFLHSLMPKGATRLKRLGKAGYRFDSPATAGHGPSVEIGWLSEAAQLQSVRFTFAKGASRTSVTTMDNRLLTLAKAMDTT